MFNMSIKVILMVAAVTASIMIAFAGGAGLYTLNEVEKNYDHIEKINLKSIEIAEDLRNQVHEANEAVCNFAMKASVDSGTVNELNGKISAAERKINDLVEEKRKIESTDEQKQILNSFIEDYRKYYEGLEKYRTLADNYANNKDKTEIVNFYNGDFNQIDNQIVKKLDNIVEKETEEQLKWSTLADQTSNKAHKLLPIAIIAFCLSMLVIAIIIGTLLEKKLKSISTKLFSQADDLNAASIRVAEASTEISSGVTEQAAAIQETAASMDEINAMIAKNAESSKKSESLATTSFHNAEKGKMAVDGMITSINSINDGTNDILEEVMRSNKKMAEIVDVINEIGEKTKVINEIVFQTKLLSFNASVEAARAGEYGKGFTVVAKEVGDLAQVSGAASEEITMLLEQSIQKVQSIVDESKSNIESLVKKSRAKVESGLEVAEDSAEILNQIVENISNVRTMVTEISIASQEQSHGVGEVNKALGQLDQATQMNSQATYQNSTAAELMKTQSGVLKTLVDDMITVIDGKRRQQKFEGKTTQTPTAKPKFNIAKKAVKAESKMAELKKASLAKEAEAKKSKPELKVVESSKNTKTASKIPTDVPPSDSPGFIE